MGAFVVLEGGDASGKSTQARLVADRLRSAGREVVETFEPGATEAGAAIRALLLDGDGPVDPTAEALLLAADRAQEVADVIRPAGSSPTSSSCSTSTTPSRRRGAPGLATGSSVPATSSTPLSATRTAGSRQIGVGSSSTPAPTSTPSRNGCGTPSGADWTSRRRLRGRHRVWVRATRLEIAKAKPNAEATMATISADSVCSYATKPM